MLESCIPSGDREIGKDTRIMHFVEHPLGVLSIHRPDEDIPPNIFNLRDEYRPITTQQMQVLEGLGIILEGPKSQGARLSDEKNREVQRLLSGIWQKR